MKKKLVIFGIVSLLLIASVIAATIKGNFDININKNAKTRFDADVLAENTTTEEKINEIIIEKIESDYWYALYNELADKWQDLVSSEN